MGIIAIEATKWLVEAKTGVFVGNVVPVSIVVTIVVARVVAVVVEVAVVVARESVVAVVFVHINSVVPFEIEMSNRLSSLLTLVSSPVVEAVVDTGESVKSISIDPAVAGDRRYPNPVIVCGSGGSDHAGQENDC